MIEIHKSKFTHIYFCEFDQIEPGRRIKFCVHFHPVEYSKSISCLLSKLCCWWVGNSQYQSKFINSLAKYNLSEIVAMLWPVMSYVWEDELNPSNPYRITVSVDDIFL